MPITLGAAEPLAASFAAMYGSEAAPPNDAYIMQFSGASLPSETILLFLAHGFIEHFGEGVEVDAIGKYAEQSGEISYWATRKAP